MKQVESEEKLTKEKEMDGKWHQMAVLVGSENLLNSHTQQSETGKQRD